VAERIVTGDIKLQVDLPKTVAQRNVTDVMLADLSGMHILGI